MATPTHVDALACDCFCLAVAKWSRCTETAWLAKPKVFTMWPFTDKVCRLLVWPVELHDADQSWGWG